MSHSKTLTTRRKKAVAKTKLAREEKKARREQTGAKPASAA